MQILDNILILALPVLAFFVGKHISDSYHAEQLKEMEYQLRLMAAEKGIGFVAPPQKIKRMPIGQNFMDKLRENGRATQQIKR